MKNRVLLDRHGLKAERRIGTTDIMIHGSSSQALTLQKIRLNLSSNGSILTIDKKTGLSGSVTTNVSRPRRHRRHNGGGRTGSHHHRITRTRRRGTGRRRSRHRTVKRVPGEKDERVLGLNLRPVYERLLNGSVNTIGLLLTTDEHCTGLNIRTLRMVLDSTRPFAFQVTARSLLTIMLRDVHLPDGVTG